MAKNILLIDDDPVTNLVNKRIIERNFDLNIVIFTDAALALAELKSYRDAKGNRFPEIILLDIDMPAMNGWEFLEALHTISDVNFERCRVIILSASIDFEDIEKSRRYKAVCDFISKPLTPEKLKVYF